MCTRENRLGEAVISCTHNLCFVQFLRLNISVYCMSLQVFVKHIFMPVCHALDSGQFLGTQMWVDRLKTARKGPQHFPFRLCNVFTPSKRSPLILMLYLTCLLLKLISFLFDIYFFGLQDIKEQISKTKYIYNCILYTIWTDRKSYPKMKYKQLSHCMRKPTICICENKGTDQLHG